MGDFEIQNDDVSTADIKPDADLSGANLSDSYLKSANLVKLVVFN